MLAGSGYFYDNTMEKARLPASAPVRTSRKIAERYCFHSPAADPCFYSRPNQSEYGSATRVPSASTFVVARLATMQLVLISTQIPAMCV